ncbi:MAG: hypothetical protein ACXADB_12920 [Candidatus Hermodarchaeia archaeon]
MIKTFVKRAWMPLVIFGVLGLIAAIGKAWYVTLVWWVGMPIMLALLLWLESKEKIKY